MKTAISIMIGVVAIIYCLMVIDELGKELTVEKALNKACSAELQWKEIQLRGAN